MADVHLPPTLTPLFAGLPRRVEVDAATVTELLDAPRGAVAGAARPAARHAGRDPAAHPRLRRQGAGAARHAGCARLPRRRDRRDQRRLTAPGSRGTVPAPSDSRRAESRPCSRARGCARRRTVRPEARGHWTSRAGAADSPVRRRGRSSERHAAPGEAAGRAREAPTARAGRAACEQSGGLHRACRRSSVGRSAALAVRARPRRRPGLQSKTRCGASGRRAASASPSRRRRSRSRDEHAGAPAAAAPARTARARPPRSPRPTTGGSSSRSARICDVGASTPGSRRDSAPELVGRRQLAEPVEEPLDEVHLRLRERRVEPDAAQPAVRAGAAASIA